MFVDNQVADALATSLYDIRVEDGKLFHDRRWLVERAIFIQNKLR
jgi:hypothetical protein